MFNEKELKQNKYTYEFHDVFQNKSIPAMIDSLRPVILST